MPARLFPRVRPLHTASGGRGVSIVVSRSSVSRFFSRLVGVALVGGLLSACDDDGGESLRCDSGVVVDGECVVPCEGESCPPLCDGDDCVPPCEGASCPAPCEGDACPPVSGCDPFCDPCLDTCDACVFVCVPPLSAPLGAGVRTSATALGGGSGTTRWALNFDVSEGTPSWLLTAWVDGELAVWGDRLRSLEGEEPVVISWDSLADNVAIQQSTSPWLASLLMPPGPQWEPLMRTGAHEVEVDVEGSDPPLWQLVEQAPAQDEGLRPYTVRVRVISASAQWPDVASMRESAELVQALETAQAIYSDAGILLQVREWVRLPSATIEAFGSVSSLAELRDLFSTVSVPYCEDPRDALVVNLVLVDGFDGDSSDFGSGIAGYTGALPGPAALHEAFGSGVAVSILQLPQVTGPRTVGQLMAHELGHYLGLQHTSEGASARRDPMPDTAECASSTVRSAPRDCGDFSNVMFPGVYNRPTVEWSLEQGRQLRRHPSVTQR